MEIITTNAEWLSSSNKLYEFLMAIKVVSTFKEDHRDGIYALFGPYAAYGLELADNVPKLLKNCSNWLVAPHTGMVVDKDSGISMINGKCTYVNGFTIKPDGKHELDPCMYEEVETHTDVTVKILRCKRCGHTEIIWSKGEFE